MSILAASKMGLPLSSVSSFPNSSAREDRRSAARVRIFPRWRGFIDAQGPDSNALRAAATAPSRSEVPASATSAIVSPVAGLTVAKRLPLAEGTKFPPMKRSVFRRSLPLELGHALLLVGGDALLGVVALEEKLLELPLHRQRRLDGKVPA